MMPRVAIIGSGSWATALAKLLLNNAPRISWYLRREEDIAYLREYHTNPRYLSAIEFETEKIDFFSSVRDCIQSADVLVLAIPSAFVHDALKDLSSADFEGKIVFSAIKGIEPHNNQIVGEYLNSF